MSITEKNNETLLRLEQQLLTTAPRLLTPEAIDELTALGISEEQAAATLIATAFGIDPDGDGQQRDFFHYNLLPSVRLMDAQPFENDPYARTLGVLEARHGDAVLGSAEYAPCECFACGDMHHDAQGHLIASLGFFRTVFRYPIIYKNGVEWMAVNPNEVITMKNAILAAIGDVLVYGLGLGYYAFMVSEKQDVASVTVVDCDADVIALFNEAILPKFPHREKLKILHSDAFDHAARCRFANPATGRPYDFVFTDIWHNVADGIALSGRMKALQQRYAAPAQRFAYWLEPTMACYRS